MEESAPEPFSLEVCLHLNDVLSLLYFIFENKKGFCMMVAERRALFYDPGNMIERLRGPRVLKGGFNHEKACKAHQAAAEPTELNLAVVLLLKRKIEKETLKQTWIPQISKLISFRKAILQSSF